ncbi:Flp pilus assembly protein TadG [Breoghania corrubedonensis]|uniref:Flp pilus assembly protein TadG n=1 Tax=Breoghania corrubedonensis TaxID=665038 RepID=A0A2T5VEY8_9HYPH|nr:TadE/TadG family type IV pilus assembly protein [Breoghania corrubedonensis]PTW62311.1 Flp pilus assembly protein TadG [Breoghania corrubedonensis]
MIRKFMGDRRGNVAMLFGLAAVPVVFAVGAGIDMADVVATKQRAQIAMDAAALTANTRTLGLTTDQVAARARDAFDANFISTSATISNFSAVPNGDGTVEVSADVSVPTSFAPLIGVEEFTFKIAAETKVGEASFDVVMVLDNSGSMGGTKISTLKTSAKDLTATLLAANSTGSMADRVKIGIVPFTAFVNVGADNADASWLDVNGLSPLNANNMEKTGVSRLALFDQIDGVTWQGCVEARPYPYDVNDDLASDDTPASLFVPQFAPDEPDEGGYYWYGNWHSYRYSNNWIDDDGGTCTASIEETGTDGHNLKQKRLCKYDGASLSTSTNGVSRGPNYGCKTQAITPLTTSRTTLDNAVTAMVADGYTNIHQGVVWGWRALSPAEPFTGGRRLDDPALPGHRRIMILMTDGANTYEWYDKNPNISKYNAYGYVTEGRAETTDSSWTVHTTMNARTAEACTNAKTDGGVEIYTIAFQVSDQSTLDMLEDCATKPSMAYKSESNSELTLAFAKIAKEITRLRVSR